MTPAAARKAGAGFDYRFDRTKYCDALQKEHEGLENGVEIEGSSEAVCGRVMAKRSFGKLAFLSLVDERGSVQLFCDKKRLDETSPARKWRRRARSMSIGPGAVEEWRLQIKRPV